MNSDFHKQMSLIAMAANEFGSLESDFIQPSQKTDMEKLKIKFHNSQESNRKIQQCLNQYYE